MQNKSIVLHLDFTGRRRRRHPTTLFLFCASTVFYFLVSAQSVNSLKKLHWSFFFTLVALSGSNRSFFHTSKKHYAVSAQCSLAETEGFAVCFASQTSFAGSVGQLTKKAPLELFLYARCPLGFESFFFSYIKKTLRCFSIVLFGGDRGIRTLAALTNPNSLANCPLRPAWVCLLI